jgi:hypothetical protein
VYHYQLQFLTCCTNGALLSGQMACDNDTGVYLNGAPAGSVAGFSAWTPINITNGFVACPSINVLDLYLTNYGSSPGDTTPSPTAFRAELTNCVFPFVVYCPTNKTVPCDSSWTFDLPIASSCCGSNVTITPVSTTTNGSCPKVITQTWRISDACSNVAMCSQMVTVVTVPPVLTCASNKTVTGGTAWSFDPPTATNTCCSNVTLCVLSIVTNVTCNPCAINYTCTWQVTDCCTNIATCSQTVTVLPTSPCQVFNTGMNGALALAGGATDPNFDLVGYPDGALVINPADVPGSYLPDGPDSQWIGPDAYSDDEPYGVYHYQLQFLLCCTNGAELNGRMAADNTAGVYLNGVQVAGITASAGYGSWTPISVNTGFVGCPSLNVLDVYVTNYDVPQDPYPSSPTAFRAELTNCVSPLLVTCPPNKTAPCGTNWTFDEPTATSCCGTNISIIAEGAVTNGVCPKFITQTWFIRDECGDFTNCSQTVTLVNTNPPVINCPGNMVVTACSNVPVCYTVTASNACCSNVTVVCTPPPCSIFEAGTTTTVHCVATDCCGNSNACSFTVTVQSCLPAPTNMVLWLPFDETSGPISANLASNAYYGSQVGSPTVVLSAYVANSLHFNGVNQYVTVPDYTGIEIGSNDLTIDAWVNRPTNGPNSLPSVIVDKRNSSNIGYSLSLSFGHLIFQMSGVNYADTGSLIVPPDGQWHFVAVSLSQSAQIASFYIDGVSNSVVPVTPANLANTNSLWIGASPLGGNRPWLGDLDEVEVFDRALAESEIQGLFDAGPCGKCKPCCYLEQLFITKATGNSIELTWVGCGVLQSATKVTGPWTDVPGATSPYIVPASGTDMFYRLECPLAPPP